MAETSSSEEEERVERSRSRDDRDRRRRKRRRRKHSSASYSDSSSSDSGSASSDESSDGERRRRDRKRRKEKKRKSHDKSDKDKSRDERHRDKRRRKKKRYRSDDSDESYDSDREKKRRLLREAKKMLRKHKSEHKSNGDVESFEAKPSSENVPKFDKISEDHYFVKSNEFATWLREEQGIYFSDLSSEETHKRFLRFVDVWNSGKLNHKYYEGIKKASRTNHNWAIKKGPDDSVVVDEEEEYALAKKRERLERKRFQKDHEAVLDDLLPKATGRERLMEMKAIRREQTRAREDSPELMKDRDVMGGGDDFQLRLAREKARREKRALEKAAVYSEKRSAFEEKEAAAMDQLRALVNVAGGKITIAKRDN